MDKLLPLNSETILFEKNDVVDIILCVCKLTLQRLTLMVRKQIQKI